MVNTLKNWPWAEIAGGLLNLAGLAVLATIFAPMFSGRSPGLQDGQFHPAVGLALVFFGMGSGFMLQRSLPWAMAGVGTLILMFA